MPKYVQVGSKWKIFIERNEMFLAVQIFDTFDIFVSLKKNGLVESYFGISQPPSHCNQIEMRVNGT